MSTPATAPPAHEPADPTKAPGPRPTVVATAITFWVVMAGTTIPTPLYPAYVDSLDLSPLTVTVLFAVYALGVLTGLLTLGGLSDRVGRRPVLWAALALSAASCAVFLAAQSLPALLVARVLSGLAAALVTGAATAAITELVPATRKASAQLIALLANMGGLAGGTLVAGIVAELAPHPLRVPWAVNGVLLLVAAIALTRSDETVTSRGGRALRVQRLTVPPVIRRAFLDAAVVGGSGFAVLGVLTAVSGLLLHSELHLDHPALTGALMALAFTCTAVGQRLQGKLAAARALPAACLLLVVAAALVVVAVRTPSLAALLAAAVCNGIGTGIAISSGLGVIARSCPPTTRGAAASTYFAILYAMLAVPAVGVGIMIRTTDVRSAGTTFGIAVAVLVSAVLVSVSTGKGRHV